MTLTSQASDIYFERKQGLELLPKNTIWSIAQDKNGFIWMGSDAGLFRFDGYKTNSLAQLIPNTNITMVRSIVADDDILWVGTKSNGLYKITNQTINRIQSKLNGLEFNKVTAMHKGANGLWFASSNHLNLITKDGNIIHYPLLNNLKKNLIITSIIESAPDNLLVTTFNSIFFFDEKNRAFTNYNMSLADDEYINSAYKDNNDTIWLATSHGAYIKERTSNNFIPYKRSTITYAINSIVSDDKNIWLGSTINGIVKVSKKDLSIVNYKHETKDSTTISGNSIMTMLIDRAGVLFASSFHGGVSYFNTSSLSFGLISNSANGVYCSSSSIFSDIDTNNDTDLWITSDSGLIKYNNYEKSCELYNKNINNENIYLTYNPITSFIKNEGERWITKSNGLDVLDFNSESIQPIQPNNFNLFTSFIFEHHEDSFLLGTLKGLYKYENNSFSKINYVNSISSNINVHSYIPHIEENHLFLTSNGLMSFNSIQKFEINTKIQSQLPTTELSSILSTKKQNLWIGTRNQGLFKFNSKSELVKIYNDKNNDFVNDSILSIFMEEKNLWMSTNKGIIKLNTITDDFHYFHKSDGLQDNLFLKGSAFKSSTGKLYFGGRNGLNSFYPKDIKLNTTPPNIVITNLTRFGKSVKPNIKYGDFIITKPINEIQTLTLTHKDYVIGFEFAALDFADPTRNKYAFRMEGQDPNWNYVNADDRKISYSNLAAGEYIFKIKGSNKDGIWNETGKSLKIKVLPAPWLTWWAYSLYLFTFFILLFGYLYWKNKANAKTTKMLRYQVDIRTKELQIQKQKIELLLIRKNEMFTNVSHEFRTPLTLIIGPINKLLKSHLARDDIKSLQMVNRNANRLLTMIEQLLLLAKMTDHENITYIPQQVHIKVETIVASFQTLAESKQLSLNLTHNDTVAINATHDCIDVILGNLLSNAIKYTPTGGSIVIKSIKNNEQSLVLEVSDTGCGLNKQQQTEIFDRFKRLNIHHNISGVGIGLALVQEVVKANKGTIYLRSQPGVGSTFSIEIASTDFNQVSKQAEPNHLLINQLIKDTNATASIESEEINYIGDKNNQSILIIDDNDDMRAHISETLKPYYYCISVNRGKAGIALAIQHIPDIIISDVMMPEMDGFQVSRIIRSDTITSHIPLILLTALNDKKNRIKGWRENIDVYLTKPFDADELLIQLDNVLVIRQILKKKARAAIQDGAMSMNSGLPEKDKKFIDKFFEVLANKYEDPNLLRPHLASLMAVSDRQLQRKLKALIDKNPLDLLREYRLTKASEILKNGYQVNITADRCGFNSVTYFAKCFKAQYGMSPKTYQQICHKKESDFQ